jgi:hypothetical protein
VTEKTHLELLNQIKADEWDFNDMEDTKKQNIKNHKLYFVTKI